MITTSKRNLFLYNIIYLYIPIFIFLIGYTKPLISIIAVLLLTYAIVVSLRKLCIVNAFQHSIQVKPVTLIISIIILIFFGYLLGWGRWVTQTGDWYKHNTILSDLTNKSWPVYYINGSEKSMLTYYIGQYLSPAIIGKLFSSFRVAEIFLFIWCELGLILIWLDLLAFFKAFKPKQQFFLLFMLLFFSMPEALSESLINGLFGIDCLLKGHISLPDQGTVLEYSGNFVCLGWVFNQAIPAWIITMLFLDYKDHLNSYFVFISPLVLFAPLPLLGLCPIVLTYIISKKNQSAWKQILSRENLIVLIVLGLIMGFYYYGNVFSKKPESIGFKTISYGNMIWVYLLFVAINVLLPAICIWTNNKKNVIYYSIIAELTLLPLFSMGLYNDLMMRASIPALFILMCLLTDTLLKSPIDFKTAKKSYKTIFFLILVLLLVSGFSYQLIRVENKIEKAVTIQPVPLNTYGSLEHLANREYLHLSEKEQKSIIDSIPEWEEKSASINPDLVYNYYSYDIEDNLFYKYLARKKISS